MTAFLVVLHLLVCVFLILFVLLQPGARGGVGAAFGGAGGQTVFGGRGANTFLAKLTGAAAVIFMLTSISLSYFGSSSTSIMTKRAPAKVEDAAKAGAAGDAKDANDDADETGADAPSGVPGTVVTPPVGDAPPAPTPGTGLPVDPTGAAIPTPPGTP